MELTVEPTDGGYASDVALTRNEGSNVGFLAFARTIENKREFCDLPIPEVAWALDGVTQTHCEGKIQMAISRTLYSSRSEEWGTPKDLFLKLNHEFRFTLDPCADRTNAKCPKFFTKRQNGLIHDWSRDRVFMNPPYGRSINDWMRKARQESQKGALVVCLVHARTDTRWWHENVQDVADEVRFVKGRLRFESPNGTRSTAPFPSAIVIYRPRHGRQD